MTPKEKGLELYNKIYGQTPTRGSELEIKEDQEFAKQCALIAIDEIIKVAYWNNVKEYWQEVKQEIEKL